MSDYSLLFDIGKVIVDFDFGVSARQIAKYSPLTAEEILLSVDELKDDLESGKITSEAFISDAAARIKYSGESDLIISALRDIFTVNRNIVSLVYDESEKGTPLHLLSNTNGIHVPYLFETFPVFHLFDSAVYSHEVGCMKPSPEIYEKTKSLLNLNPEKTIYIDDLSANCEEGRRHGFHTIQYDLHDHEKFLSEFTEVKRKLIRN